MKLFILLGVLISFSAHSSNSRIEMSFKEIIKYNVDIYNTHKTLESAVDKLFLSDVEKKEIHAVLKKNKITNVSITPAKAIGTRILIGKSKVDLTDLKTGFIKVDEKMIQVKGKSFEDLTTELRALKRKSAFSFLINEAFADDLGALYSTGVLTASVRGYHEIYERCLVSKVKLDAMISAGYVENQTEYDRVLRETRILCKESVGPAAYLQATLDRTGMPDIVRNLTCENDTLQSFSSEYGKRIWKATGGYEMMSITRDSTLGLDRVCLVKCAEAGLFRTYYNCWEEKELKHNYLLRYKGETGVNANRNPIIGCQDTDIILRQASNLIMAGRNCCSKYPDNIIAEVSSSGRRVMRNLCHTNLLITDSPIQPGRAREILDSLKAPSSGTR